MKPMFLRDVEENSKPSAWLDAIRLLQSQGQEYPQIWHMFSYVPNATRHLAAFTQEMMREAGPLTPGFRELIAARTSSENQCPF